MIAHVCRDLGRLVSKWWMNDRIRVSPREGQLLRIEPGDVVLIGEVQMEVVTCSIFEKAAGSTLCLSCRTQTGSAELQFDIATPGKASSILWKNTDGCRLLSPRDFEVWPRL